MTYGYVAGKDALVKRLHRIEGQVRGIERMVVDERYCIDILTQIAAVNTALESLALEVLDDHVTHTRPSRSPARCSARGPTSRRQWRSSSPPRTWSSSSGS